MTVTMSQASLLLLLLVRKSMLFAGYNGGLNHHVLNSGQPVVNVVHLLAYGTPSDAHRQEGGGDNQVGLPVFNQVVRHKFLFSPSILLSSGDISLGYKGNALG